MDIELKELSAIYLQSLHEEETGGNEEQSSDVGAHAKAIRYQSRRDNVPLPKAFNDYVAKNQLSGSERTALRQKLGFMGEEVECAHNTKGKECPVHGKKDCSVKEEEDKIGGGNLKKMSTKATKRIDANVDGHADSKDMKSSETGEFLPGPDGKKIKSKFRAEHVRWRTELSEYTDANPKAKTSEKTDNRITEKKVKNKININPPQGMTEAIEQLGGQILEMVEIVEAVYGGTPKEEEPKDTRMVVTNADKKGNTPAYQKMKAGDKRYKKADHMGEEIGSTSTNDAQEKRQLAAKEQMMKKQHMLSRQRLQMQKQGKLPSGHMESTEDSLRDKRQERGGVDGNVDYRRPAKNVAMGGGKKKPYDGMSALEKVKASIRAKHGQGAIMDTRKK